MRFVMEESLVQLQLRAWALDRVGLDAARFMLTEVGVSPADSRAMNKAAAIDWLLANKPEILRASRQAELQGRRAVETAVQCGAVNDLVGGTWCCTLDTGHDGPWHRRGRTKWAV